MTESAVQEVAAGHVAIVEIARVATGAVREEIRREDQAAASTLSSVAVSVVVAVAHHLRLRAAETVDGATMAPPMRKEEQLLVTGRITRLTRP